MKGRFPTLPVVDKRTIDRLPFLINGQSLVYSGRISYLSWFNVNRLTDESTADSLNRLLGVFAETVGSPIFDGSVASLCSVFVKELNDDDTSQNNHILNCPEPVLKKLIEFLSLKDKVAFMCAYPELQSFVRDPLARDF